MGMSIWEYVETYKITVKNEVVTVENQDGKYSLSASDIREKLCNQQLLPILKVIFRTMLEAYESDLETNKEAYRARQGRHDVVQFSDLRKGFSKFGQVGNTWAENRDT